MPAATFAGFPVVPEFGAYASDLTTYPASAVGIPPAAAAAVRACQSFTT